MPQSRSLHYPTTAPLLPAASRPASWSKILAVLSALDAYDWVMWVDADILITNTSMPLERLLPAAAAGDPLNQPSGPDFILTEDAAGGPG